MVDAARDNFCQNGRTMARYARVVVVEVPGGEVSPGTNVRCGYGGAMFQNVQGSVVVLNRVAGARGEAPDGRNRGADRIQRYVGVGVNSTQPSDEVTNVKIKKEEESRQAIRPGFR